MSIVIRLFGGIGPSPPNFPEGVVPSETGPAVFGRKTLAVMYSGDNLVHRRTALNSALASVWVESYQYAASIPYGVSASS